MEINFKEKILPVLLLPVKYAVVLGICLVIHNLCISIINAKESYISNGNIFILFNFLFLYFCFIGQYIIPPLIYILVFSRKKITIHPYFISFLYFIVVFPNSYLSVSLFILITFIISIVIYYHFIILKTHNKNYLQKELIEKATKIINKHLIVKVIFNFCYLCFKYIIILFFSLCLYVLIGNFISIIGFPWINWDSHYMGNQYEQLLHGLIYKYPLMFIPFLIPSTLFIILFSRSSVSIHTYIVTYIVLFILSDFSDIVSIEYDIYTLQTIIILIIITSLVNIVHLLKIKQLQTVKEL